MGLETATAAGLAPIVGRFFSRFLDPPAAVELRAAIAAELAKCRACSIELRQVRARVQLVDMGHRPALPYSPARSTRACGRRRPGIASLALSFHRKRHRGI